VRSSRVSILTLMMNQLVVALITGCLGVAGIQALSGDTSEARPVGTAHWCAIGDKASLDIRRTAPGSDEAVIGKVLVLGCRRLDKIGRIEVVGFRTKLHACVSVDYPTQKESEPLGCGERSVPNWSAICPTSPVCPSPVAWTDTKVGIVSRVNGIVDRRISSTQIILQRDPKKLSVKADLVRLPMRWTRVIDLPTRMSVFVSVFAGCPPAGRLVAEARLETSRRRKVRRSIPNLLPLSCTRQAGE